MAEAQKHSGNAPSARAPIAFASIAFMVAQLGIGVAENAVCGGIDLAGLLYVLTRPFKSLLGLNKILTLSVHATLRCDVEPTSRRFLL